jgi:hypothetical protein
MASFEVGSVRFYNETGTRPLRTKMGEQMGEHIHNPHARLTAVIGN